MVKTPTNQATASGSRPSTRNSATKLDSRGTRGRGLGSGKKLSERTPTTIASSSKKRKASDDASPTVAKRSKVKSTSSASKKKKVIVEVEIAIEESPVVEVEEEIIEDETMGEQDEEVEIDPFDEIAVRKVVERTGVSPRKKKEKKVIKRSSSDVEPVDEEEEEEVIVVVKSTPVKRGRSAKKDVIKKTPIKQKVIKQVKSEVITSTINDSDSEGDEVVASQLLGSKPPVTPSRSSRSAPALVPSTGFVHSPTKRGTSKSTPNIKKSPTKPSATPTNSPVKATRSSRASTSKALPVPEPSEDDEEVGEEEDLEEAQDEEAEEGSNVIEEGEEVDGTMNEEPQEEDKMEIEEAEEEEAEIEKSVVDDEEEESIEVEIEEAQQSDQPEEDQEEENEEQDDGVISESPSKTKSKTSIPRARSASLSYKSSSSSSSNESSESGSDSESDDDDGLEVQKPDGDNDESPRSSRDPSPSSNGSRATSEDPRGVRSSARARHLPVAQADINNMPLNLRSDLVGWHDENSPIKASTAASKKSKSKSKSSKSSRVRTEPEHVTKYPSKMLQDLIERMGQVISGNRLPEPDLTEGGFDETKVENWPYVEQWKTWEKPMRYAMENVVRDGVGNCVIVLGPRGVGKSAMVNRGLNIIENVHGAGSFICVRLNGLVQTTDRQALRTIARQLKSQGFVEEGGDYGSNAATMSTLLKMLEPANDPTAVADKPIIIILDEFDLFALHPRQSFLYCLLDIVQGNRRKAGMGVIGLSARTDCLSILEKRVRSRCQSQVYQMVYPNDLEKYLRHARDLLSADVLYWENKSQSHRKMAKEWNAEVKAFMKESKVKDYFERIWSLYGNNPAHLLAALSPMYLNLEWDSRYTDEPQWPPTLNEEIVDEIGMDDDEAEAPGQLIPRLHLDLLPKADEGGKRTSLIRDCSILELNVCVAAKHLRDDHDNTINLEMLYDAYNAHVKRRNHNISSRRLSKTQFAFAFDHLREMEVFLPHSGKPSWFVAPSSGDTFKMYRFIPWASTVDDEIARRGSDAPTALVKWCKSWQN